MDTTILTNREIYIYKALVQSKQIKTSYLKDLFEYLLRILLFLFSFRHFMLFTLKKKIFNEKKYKGFNFVRQLYIALKI